MPDVRTQPRPVLFLWGQFGPYHRDRCAAAAAALDDRAVIGLEVADGSALHYDWQPKVVDSFTKITLFPGETYEGAGLFRRLVGLVRKGTGAHARHNFLCHYDQPEVFVLAAILRLFGRRVFVLFESKFDDRPRSVWREVFKWFFLLPYNGALTSGPRARAYLSFLGIEGRPIADGYDTVSAARLRELARATADAQPIRFEERPFVVVARLVAKKNLPLALAAYDLYRRRAGSSARGLVFLGSGPLEEALKAEAAQRGLDSVRFAGFVQEEGVAREVSRALALILPSIEEQWGLVVNEALALGVPVLCSENVGARETLIREGENGYVFAAADAERLSRLMEDLAGSEARWHRMSLVVAESASAGDTERFAEGVKTLVEALP